MILLDANIFMYAGGKDHPQKKHCLAVLEEAARGHLDVATDAEVLQEILHRYRALGLWREGTRLYALARRIVPHVVAITGEVVEEARGLLDAHPALSVRDAIHAAVVLGAAESILCSCDRDFDVVTNLRRIEPAGILALPRPR